MLKIDGVDYDKLIKKTYHLCSGKIVEITHNEANEEEKCE